MIRRRSLKRSKRRSRISRRSKKRSKRRSKKRFGTIEKTEDTKDTNDEQKLKKDPIFNISSAFFKPKKVINFFRYSNNLTEQTFNEIKQELEKTANSGKLGKFGGIDWLKLKYIEWYKPKIDKVIEKLSPEQIVLISEGKYDNELRDMILFRKDPPPVENNRIGGFKQNLKLYLLKYYYGGKITTNIKKFLMSLTPTQMLLIIKGNFDLGNAIYNSVLKTKYRIIKPAAIKPAKKKT